MNWHQQYTSAYLSYEHGTAGNLSSFSVDAQAAWSLCDTIHISSCTHAQIKLHTYKSKQNDIISKFFLDVCTRTQQQRKFWNYSQHILTLCVGGLGCHVKIIGPRPHTDGTSRLTGVFLQPKTYPAHNSRVERNYGPKLNVTSHL